MPETSPFDLEYEAKKARAIELNRSLPLDYALWSHHERVERLIDVLYDDILPILKLKRPRVEHIRAHIKVILLNHLVGRSRLKDPWIGYSRRPGNYPIGRYNPSSIGRSLMLPIVEALIALGLVEHAMGFQDTKNPANSRSSRIKATPLFQDLLDEYQVDASMAFRLEREETIILRAAKQTKGKAGKLVDYTDTAHTLQMRRNLKRINELNSAWNITLDLDEEVGEIDFSRTRLKRIFNNESFEEGGRFYGGWWQSLSESQRQHIKFNDTPSIEIDYSNLHIRMLYAKEGIEYDGDVYQIEGVPRELRPVIKQILLRIVNADTQRKFMGSIMKDLAEPTLRYFPAGIVRLVNLIKKKHRPIAHHFHSGDGLKSQYRDSVLAEMIMLSFVERGQPILPVHDSFIVSAWEEHELKTAMLTAFAEEYGVAGKVDVGEVVWPGVTDDYADSDDWLYWEMERRESERRSEEAARKRKKSL